MLNQATEIRLRAERQAGLLLIQMAYWGERERFHDKNVDGIELPSLRSLGIKKNQSSLWQARARLSEKDFEESVQAAKRLTAQLLNRSLTAAQKRQRREEREAGLAALALTYPTKKYNVIYEDFEWDFQVRSRDTGMDRHAANHYSTADGAHSAEEIYELTKKRFDCAAPDCVLFMWTTGPFLAVAIPSRHSGTVHSTGAAIAPRDPIDNLDAHDHCAVLSCAMRASPSRPSRRAA